MLGGEVAEWLSWGWSHDGRWETSAWRVATHGCACNTLHRSHRDVHLHGPRTAPAMARLGAWTPVPVVSLTLDAFFASQVAGASVVSVRSPGKDGVAMNMGRGQPLISGLRKGMCVCERAHTCTHMLGVWDRGEVGISGAATSLSCGCL